MDQNVLYLLLFAALILVVIGYVLYRKHKVKNADKLQKTFTEDEKIHLSLDKKADFNHIAELLLEGLGGAKNVSSVMADGQRIKAAIVAYEAVDEAKLKSAHIGGVLRPQKTMVHLIIGSEAADIAETMNRKLQDETDRS